MLLKNKKKWEKDFKKTLVKCALNFSIMICPATEQACKYYSPQCSSDEGCLISPECIQKEKQ